MRKAGELFEAFNREKRLAANRSEPIGAGGYGVVYPSDVDGNVIKELRGTDELYGQSLERETNLQAIAAEMGIAPKIAGLEKFTGNIGNRMEMQDVRTNFSPVRGSGENGDGYPLDPTVRLRTSQQVGQLALKGIDLGDRHSGNIVTNNMTGRPMQLDFGLAQRVEGEDQVMALANATVEGFEAAGMPDIAEIYRDTVYDLLAGGDLADAMDIAKQGFSRLQKL